MKLTEKSWGRAAMRLALGVAMLCLAGVPAQIARAQAFTTTTVQGTVYLANGMPGAGTLTVSWPSFTTAAGQLVTADKMTVGIPADGFVSVNLAPNLGSTPAGQYYTAVFNLSDGSVTTQYWVIPAATQASLAQVQAQVMPAAQAVQAVSKTYVDQTVAQAIGSQLTVSGGNLTGPLYLSGDPTQPLQAADKHYVDTSFSAAMPLSGGVATGPLTATQLGAAYQVDQFPGADFGAKLQACVNAVSTAYGGTCDARNFTGTVAMASDLNISAANVTVDLPCATIATANHIVVTAGTRNVSLRGCALRGGSAAGAGQGGTVFEYTGAGPLIQVGDSTYAANTMGFHLDNIEIDATGSTNATSQGLAAYRTQEMDVESIYFLGNSNQTGMTLDGTGNYTGGTFFDDAFNGFGTAVNAIGHQVANPATSDWLNASTFIRLHIDCPTSNGSPIAGTIGINLQQGDGNTFTGGDVEGCATALHLGPNAQNNTIVGLRNQNSTSQVVADAGSSYNDWIAGGTISQGALTDNGTRNSFTDAFHRSFNGINGDWYESQTDATITNHFRLGIGNGNERGLLNRYQTDYGYRWTTGLSDAAAGEQFYQILDELNNVDRLAIGQYNHGQSSTNNQTVINAAGTGAVVLNGSNNAGTGGVVFGSGGPSETTVATIDNAGNAQFNGTLQVGGSGSLYASFTAPNAIKFPGLAASSGSNCLQVDSSGNMSNTGAPCGSGSLNGTVTAGNTGQIAYYNANGSTLAGITTIPVSAGGTGGATASAALANILPGAASDGSNGLSLTGNVAAAQMVSQNSPATDIRAYGAKTDGSTDVSAAINSAINSCPNTFGSTPGGLSCRILLPCGGAGCYVSDASNLAAAPGGTQIEIDLQGKLILGSTLALPDNMDLVAKGGGAGGQFQWGGAAAQLVSPSARGTVGTAITSTNAPVTITPSFSSGSIANLPVNSAITIAGTTTCSASASRAANGVVTLTYSAYCRIPAGATVNIASCSDGTFNATNAVLQSTDYPGQTATWNSSTASAASATGCSVTGFNDDDFETVRVYCSNGNADSGYACGAGQITVVPAQTHSASDIWGEVAVAPPGNTFNHHVMEGISVTGCQGACLFLEHIGVFRYSNDSFRSAQAITSIPADIYSSFSGNFDNDVFFGMTDWGCNYNCSTASNPASFRCTLETGYLNNSGDGTCGGLVFLQDSWVVGEIKTDTNGLTSISGHPASLALPVMRNLIVEQPRQFVVEEDSRNTGGQGTDVTLTNVFPQDNFSLQAYVACTDEGCGKATAIVNNFSGINTRNIVNNYWQGNVQSDHADEQMTWPYGRYAPAGIFTGDGQIKAEIPSIGANFAPSVIPYATQNLPANLGSWAAFGGASIVTGIPAPDGSTNAVDVLQGSGNGLAYTTAYNGATSAGDVFLFGGWTRPGVNETRTGNAYYSAAFRLNSGGTDSFQPSGGTGATSQLFELNMTNASWRPVVALAVIKAGEASTHQITMQLLAGSANGAGNEFFAPFVIYVPASAGIPMAEIERWRQELLHGYVPPNLSGPGIAMDPNLKLFLNPSVDLYASGSQLQTDEAFQAAALKSTASGCNSTAAYMKYDGTCGNGAAGGSTVPTIATVAPTTTTSLTGANGTFATTTAAGQYRVCAWFDNIVAGTAGYYYFYIQYTSDGHGFTTTIIGNTSGSAQWTQGQACYNFYADAASQIKWGMGTSGLTGTPTERYAAALEQLQ